VIAARPVQREMGQRRDHGSAPAFEVAAVILGGLAAVAVRGEVDLVTAPELTAALEERIRRSSGPLVVDLSAVDFLDSCGIHCLVRARALLGRKDRQLAIVCPRANVRRVLELAGIDQLVALYDSHDELA
jgi:anti-sigma B factor antagonist